MGTEQQEQRQGLGGREIKMPEWKTPNYMAAGDIWATAAVFVFSAGSMILLDFIM